MLPQPCKDVGPYVPCPILLHQDPVQAPQQYPVGRLFSSAWAKAIMPQGDFWQHQTILSALLSSHLYKFSLFFHVSFQDDSFLFGWFSYPKYSWAFPDYCLIQKTFIIFDVISVVVYLVGFCLVVYLSFCLFGWLVVGFLGMCCLFLASILSNSFEYSTHIHCLHSHSYHQILLPRVFYQGKATRSPPQRCGASSSYGTKTLLQKQTKLRLCTDHICLSEVLRFDDKGLSRSLQTV